MGCFLVAYDIAFQHVGNEETLYTCRNHCCFALPNVQCSSIQRNRESSTKEDQCMQMQVISSDILNRQWGPWPISKLTPFIYWNRKLEIKVSTHTIMGWGLFLLEVAKVGDKFLPFVGQWVSKTEFKTMCNANSQFIKYALRLKMTVYHDGDIRNGNIAGYINSSIGREKMQMCVGSMCHCRHHRIPKFGNIPWLWQQETLQRESSSSHINQ